MAATTEPAVAAALLPAATGVSARRLSVAGAPGGADKLWELVLAARQQVNQEEDDEDEDVNFSVHGKKLKVRRKRDGRWPAVRRTARPRANRARPRHQGVEID